MRVTDAAHVGTHGRMRQHIVSIGGVRPNSESLVPVMKDRFLCSLVHDGILTTQQLQDAVKGYSRTPSNYLWLTGVDQAVLDLADRVFLAEYGRFPTDDADFLLNGGYHRICRGLEYDRHYYDKQLRRLHWDENGNPYVRSDGSIQPVEEVRDSEIKRGSGLLFGLALVAGAVGGPIIAAMIARNVSHDLVPSVSVFAIVWILSLTGLLAKTLPRRIVHKNTVFKCGRCGRELSPTPQMVGCLACGLLFEDRKVSG